MHISQNKLYNFGCHDLIMTDVHRKKNKRSDNIMPRKYVNKGNLLVKHQSVDLKKKVRMFITSLPLITFNVTHLHYIVQFSAHSV